MSVLAAVGVANVGLSAIAAAVQGLYKVSGELNSFIDNHIEEMKQPDKPTVARTGAVLEAAKVGLLSAMWFPWEFLQPGSCCLEIRCQRQVR
jgi:hypothetical protein